MDVTKLNRPSEGIQDIILKWISCLCETFLFFAEEKSLDVNFCLYIWHAKFTNEL